MIPSLFGRFLPCSVLFGFTLTSSLDAAVSIQFGSGTWDHSSFGGPSNSTGWSANAASSPITGGSTNLVDGGEEVEVTILIETFGTTVASHSAFHSGAGNRLSTSTTFNGSAPSTSPALVIANKNDTDFGVNSLSNYSKVTFSFNKPVKLSNFILGDIDHRTGWQDMVGISSSLNDSSVGNSIVSAATGYHEVLPGRTYGGLFPAGTISGQLSGSLDSAGSADNALAQVQFGGLVDQVDIYFWNTGTSGEQHAIFVKSGDIEISEIVPEPSSALLGIFGLACLVGRRQR